MRYRYVLAALLGLTAPGLVRAQTSPVITVADMPVPTDTLRQSTAAVALPASAPPLSRIGPNQTWNYAGLMATAQNVARFSGIPNQPLYTLTFGSAVSGPNKATVAASQTLPLPPGITLPFSEPYQFFRASATEFRSVGYGATVGGTAIPVLYASTNEQDVMYRLPLSYASQPDSSRSFFSINVPGTGYLSQRRKRVNKVDAWGTLTTPFGTFATIRVVTRLQDHDSVSVGGTSQGLDLPLTREYKWLAVGQHVPLLTITTNQLANQEVVTRVEYRDVYRRIAGPLGTAGPLPEAALAVFPNPLAPDEALHLRLPGPGAVTLTATDLTGRRIFQRRFTANTSGVNVAPETFGNFQGVLLLKIETAAGVAVRRLMRQ